MRSWARTGPGKARWPRCSPGTRDTWLRAAPLSSRARISWTWSPTKDLVQACSWLFSTRSDIPGVSIAHFLRTALQARLEEGEELDLFDFQDELLDRMKLLEMDPSFAERPVNDGFSGGEKKRNEILQMAVLRPTLAIMDETDSGLDIDALQVVAQGVNALRGERPEMSVLLITHYQRLLNYIQPDRVHVMVDGRIVRSGGPDVALQLEEDGYREFQEEESASVV